MTRLKTFVHGSTLTNVDLNNIQDDAALSFTTYKDLWECACTATGMLSANTYIAANNPNSTILTQATAPAGFGTILIPTPFQTISGMGNLRARIVGFAAFNSTAPGATITFALKPITSFATTGSGGPFINVLGTTLTSTTVVSTSSAIRNFVSADGDVTSSGSSIWAVAVNIASNQAAGSTVSIGLKVQYRYA